MFSGLWAKLAGAMGAIIGVMAVMLKLKNHKIENLEEENAAHEMKDEIIEDMGLAEVKAKEKQDEALKNNDGADYMDRL